jgi:sugar phosphate isomerase/epimerase
MDDDFAATLERVAAMGFVGVETAGLHGIAPAAFARQLEDLGLAMINAFVGLPRDGVFPHEVLDSAAAAGAPRLVVNAWAEDFSTTEAIDQLATSFNLAARQARTAGLALGYHNHFWEFLPSDAAPNPMAVFASQLEDWFFELDIYWLTAATADPPAALSGLLDHIELVHVKDGPCTLPSPDWTRLDPMTPAGTGRVDVAGLLKALPRAAWHVVEFDAYDGDTFEALDASRSYLIETGLSRSC